jgi:hypothetical protein
VHTLTRSNAFVSKSSGSCLERRLICLYAVKIRQIVGWFILCEKVFMAFHSGGFYVNYDNEMHVHMQVFFYIDPEFATDPKMNDVNNLILSYTFFKVEEDNKEEVVSQDRG